MKLFSWSEIIGAGTVVNAVLLGYIVTFFYNLLSNGIGIPEVMWQRLIIVCIGVVVCSFGVSMYQTPVVGAAPYDSMSLIMAMQQTVDFVFLAQNFDRCPGVRLSVFWQEESLGLVHC